MSELILGTRASTLARRQTGMVADAIRCAAPSARLAVKTITTRGDRDRQAPLSSFGGVGVFVKELELALLAGSIDVAVHSLKDLPSATTEGLCIAAIPAREDARDALLSQKGGDLHHLPRNARVGTSSPRRRAQVLSLRPDLSVRDLRGNLDTRLRRLDEGDFDAIVLATAGLCRLGLQARITQRLPHDMMLPAPGQGALAIQVRAGDAKARDVLRPLSDPDTVAAVEAERAFLAAIGGGCHLPVGAYASVSDGTLSLAGCVLALDGSTTIRDEASGTPEDAAHIGASLAEALLLRGAAAMLHSLHDRKDTP
ncbi:hydroxymethylbilane synthase [bacterium]|nr:hydroxymethylbilane synthase [bacterium]